MQRNEYEIQKEKCGATLCKDLKGRDTGVILCECDDCVRNAIEVIHELFEDWSKKEPYKINIVF